MLSEEKKHSVLAQIKAVLEGETDMIARMANAAALLREGFGFWWTGFYRVLPVTGIKTAPGASGPGANGDGAELVLGPFQGPVACQRIAFGRGVCGTAWKEARTIVVPDVEQFPGHIACSSESRSEVVVPLFKDAVRLASKGSEAEGGAGNLASKGREAEGSTGHLAPKGGEGVSGEGAGEAQQPGQSRREIFAVLDIDSRELATFDESDVPFLEEVAAVIASEANV